MTAPYQPFDFGESAIHEVDLSGLASELVRQPAYEQSGRAASTIAREERMTVVLTVLRKDIEIHEHGTPGPVTLLVLSGSLSLHAGSGSPGRRLEAGNGALFPPEVRHRIVGLEDCAFLLVIGGRTHG